MSLNNPLVLKPGRLTLLLNSEDLVVGSCQIISVVVVINLTVVKNVTKELGVKSVPLRYLSVNYRGECPLFRTQIL